jgi:hypothetical protein
MSRDHQMGSFLVDKAYSSRRDVQAIAAKCTTPYIPFRRGFTAGNGASTMWSKQWRYYQFNRDDFLAHYHQAL